MFYTSLCIHSLTLSAISLLLLYADTLYLHYFYRQVPAADLQDDIMDVDEDVSNSQSSTIPHDIAAAMYVASL